MTEIAMPSRTVHVVDDDSTLRSFLSELLKTHNLEAVTYDSAQRFLAEFRPGTPGCLVLDVNLPGMSGLELQKELADRSIEIPIIILTGAGDVEMARNAFRSGVVDFVTKPFRNADLLECIHQALARDAVSRQRRAVLDNARSRFARLSSREREVIDQLVQGRSTKEIAFALSLSSKTVDVHRSNSMRKLEVSSVAELVRLYMTLKSDQEIGANP